MSEEQALKTVKEAAEILGFTPGHVRRLIGKGQLGAVKVGGWRTMIPLEEVSRLQAAQNKVEPMNNNLEKGE